MHLFLVLSHAHPGHVFCVDLACSWCVGVTCITSHLYGCDTCKSSVSMVRSNKSASVDFFLVGWFFFLSGVVLVTNVQVHRHT